jgi:hypothetical protein
MHPCSNWSFDSALSYAVETSNICVKFSVPWRFEIGDSGRTLGWIGSYAIFWCFTDIGYRWLNVSVAALAEICRMTSQSQTEMLLSDYWCSKHEHCKLTWSFWDYVILKLTIVIKFWSCDDIGSRRILLDLLMFRHFICKRYHWIKCVFCVVSRNHTDILRGLFQRCFALYFRVNNT